METKRDGLFNYHPLSDRERKNIAILELIRKDGPISRAEISRITDINVVSVSSYIKSYIDAGLVTEKGLDESSGGRRPELIELNKKDIYVIGLSLNSSRISGSLVGIDMNVIKKANALYDRPSPEDSLSIISGVIDDLLKTPGVTSKSVKAIGIGVPHNNFIFLRDGIEKKFGIPVFAGNDASCAVFGEKMMNPVADVADLLYMYSDVGCGIVVRGDIYLGSGGSAGEMQISNMHISKEEEAVLLRDSRYLKPWGNYLGITSAAKREIERGVGTKMVAIARGEINNVTKEVVIEAARQNDEVASYIIQDAAVNLGIRIAYLVNLFNPEVVVIGGGIEKAGELILNPIIDKVKKFAFSAQANMVKIIPSVLGDDAVSLGAASLAVREVFLRA